MHFIALMAVLLSSRLTFHAVVVEDVPPQFVGVWSPDLNDCASGDNDGIVRIAKRYIGHWESEGPIRAVVVRGKYEIALITELAGEGDTRLTTERFELDPSGSALYSRNHPAHQSTLFRCPDEGERPNDSSRPKPLHGVD